MKDVLFRAMLPNMVDSLRITLGWCWTYLIVAEIVASNSGIGYELWTARRYGKTPEVFAGILTIGVIGLVSDQAIRFGHRRWFRYLELRPHAERLLHRIPRADEGLLRRARPHRRRSSSRCRSTSRKASSWCSSGPSGCGKTTVMRMVGGLETPTTGEVLLDGTAASTAPSREKGMVFQSYSSFPWLTVLGNIRFGLKYRNDIASAEKERIARHYLDLVGLDALRRLPHQPHLRRHAPARRDRPHARRRSARAADGRAVRGARRADARAAAAAAPVAPAAPSARR